MDPVIDITQYESDFGAANKVARLLWNITYWILFRPINLGVLRRWRVFLLRCFGAKIDWTANVYASVKVWAPWNLEMGANACLGPRVDCYNQGRITIGGHTTVSQKCYLCSSSHDYSNRKHPLIIRPITIADQAWIAADAFIGPGVTVAQGAVVGARAAVFKDVEAWTVVGGNPAVFIKKRVIV